MGNTVPMLFKHYRGLLTEQEAVEHFAILPKDLMPEVKANASEKKEQAAAAS
jgi:hypothetical protein